MGSTAQPVWPGRSFFDQRRLSRRAPLRAHQIHVERVGHRAVEQRRRFGHNAAAKLHHGHHVGVVLEVALLVVRECRDLRDFVAREPPQHVDRVTPGQEHAAAAGLLLTVQIPGVVRRSHPVPIVDLGVKQFADGSGGQQRFEVRDQGIPPEHEAHQALYAGLGDGIAQCPVLGHRQRDRLFHEHVFAGVGGGDGLLGMNVARPRNVDHVNLCVSQRIFQAVAHPAGQPKVPGQAFRALPVKIAHGD